MMNQKGGVGKTTSTVNLGAALAEAGKNVCLIDLDPQSHLTINCGVDPTSEMISLYDVLVEGKPLSEAVRRVDERMSLIPASIDLAGAEVELAGRPERQTLLKRRIEAEADWGMAGKLSAYDYVLLDCPPSLGLLTLNALAAAGEVVIPMQPHFLALQGVSKLLETVSLVSQRINPSLRVSGILLTMFDGQARLSGEVVNDLRTFLTSAADQRLPWSGAMIFKSKIRRNIKLAESPGFGQTILKYDSSSHGAADYRALAVEVLAMRQSPAESPAAAVA
jgi:chromosome partitioning protein